tara:strand:+ start:4165 stop:4308 length:144 start_codon:yes stop_codon:yes gene_type:complete
MEVINTKPEKTGTPEKKENTLDIISKSVNQNIVNQMCNLNFFNHGNY